MKTYLAILIVLLSAFIGIESRKDECAYACKSCESLSLFMNSKTCPNCDCLRELKSQIEENRCENKIDRSIYCPAGFEIDYKGCTQGYCKQNKKCDWTFMSKCERVCHKGYLVGPDGCPTCECQCDNEGLSLEDFADKCGSRCGKNDEITIEEDASGCRACICSKAGRMNKLCKDQDLTLECKNSCGKWPRNGGCSENRCECRCPNRGLTCHDVKCPRGEVAKLLKDKYGCEIGCKCKSEIESSAVCPKEVTCPSSCGPYDFREVRDNKGCMIDCHCKCENPRCPMKCKFGFKVDHFGCPTCDCLPEHIAYCPDRCNNTCGPYKFESPKDNEVCRTDCHCLCGEPKCPEACFKTESVTNRYGCEECKCASTVCPKNNCKKQCGPHGVMKRWDDCPTESCECKCPRLKCPPCPEGLGYMKDGYGCPTCQCQCGIKPSDCPPCPGGYKVDQFGCQRSCECKSDKCNRVDCSDAKCHSKMFAVDRNGCETCKCCAIDVTRCKSECKIFRTDNEGCPTCDCVQ